VFHLCLDFLNTIFWRVVRRLSTWERQCPKNGGESALRNYLGTIHYLRPGVGWQNSINNETKRPAPPPASQKNSMIPFTWILKKSNPRPPPPPPPPRWRVKSVRSIGLGVRLGLQCRRKLFLIRELKATAKGPRIFLKFRVSEVPFPGLWGIRFDRKQHFSLPKFTI
jgi:hypothetical protein